MRYIPHTSEEIQTMLKSIGMKSLDDLFSGIPDRLLEKGPLALDAPLDEGRLTDHLEELSRKNNPAPLSRSFMGGGLYRHRIPWAVRDLIRRSEFLTPYTPYQPEMAQGTLQVMFEFQTMVAEIYGMEIANASLYDGSTALAEAVLMALRIKRGRKTILFPSTLHPEYKGVVETTLKAMGENLVTLPASQNGGLETASLHDYLNDDLAACVFPYPNFFGIVEDLAPLVRRVQEQGAVAIFCVTEPLSLGFFESPGALGADIVCGEGQSLGLSPSFGGPVAGLFAAKSSYVRQMPGRLCGMTTDTKGKRGFVLTLSTREQHIRREKATSNICTNQALCATQIAIHLSLLGKAGFQKLARLNWERAERAKKEWSRLKNVSLRYPEAATFNEFVMELPRPAAEAAAFLKGKGWDAGVALEKWFPERKNELLVSVTEMNEIKDIRDFAADLAAALAG